MIGKTIQNETGIKPGKVPKLPELTEGVNILNSRYTSKAFHILVAKDLYTAPGKVLWADSCNNSDSYIFTDKLAPEKPVYNRIKVARAFTTHKHLGLIQKTLENLDQDTSMVAIPALLHLYRNGDTPKGEAYHLLELALEKIEEMKNRYNVKILISSPLGGGMGRKMLRIADKVIDLEKTSEGTVFRTKDFETQSFGAQTNLKYWENQKKIQKPVIEQILA